MRVSAASALEIRAREESDNGERERMRVRDRRFEVRMCARNGFMGECSGRRVPNPPQLVRVERWERADG